MAPNLSYYKRQNRGTGVTKDIRDRWAGRVMTDYHPSGGRASATAYLQRYGRNIGSAKCIKFAVYATSRGFPDFAEAFWEKAFQVDHPGIPFHSVATPPPPGSSAADLPDIFNT